MKRRLLTIMIVLALSLTSIFAATLSDEDAEKIFWIREEEKLARDVYIGLYEIWGIRTFDNISRSEQVHMDAIRDEIIIPNGLEDPVKSEKPGVFTNPEIKKLYDELMLKGSSSVQNAIEVGLLIEDMDIFDLKRTIEMVEDETIKVVLQHLQEGSENHMRAFNKQAERYGVEYEPEYISRQEMNGILSGQVGSGQNSEGNQEANHAHENCDDCDGTCNENEHDKENNHAFGNDNDNGNNGEGNDSNSDGNGNTGGK